MCHFGKEGNTILGKYKEVIPQAHKVSGHLREEAREAREDVPFWESRICHFGKVQGSHPSGPQSVRTLEGSPQEAQGSIREVPVNQTCPKEAH
jgi:hypothetical protein